MERGALRSHIRWFIVLVAIAAANGQQLVKVMSGTQMRVLHAAMDENNDAMVSLDEASAFVKGLRTSLELQNSLQIMETIDANKDGSLSQQEYVEDLRHLKITHERRQHFGGKFMAFDDNGDAVLSHEEALPLFNFMFTFQNLDSNKE